MGLFDDMEIFARVVENGSFSRAGTAMGLSRSRVSESVRALEDRLGVRLFDRNTRRVRPTEAGNALYGRCRRAIDEAQAGLDEVAALAEEPVGTLRIGVLSDFCDLFVVPALAVFLPAHPRLRVELVESEQPVDLVENRLDLAIRLAMDPDPSLIVRRIGEAQVVICAAPEYLAAHGRPSHPHDIGGHPCVSYTRLFWEREWRFSGPEGALTVPVTPTLLCSSTSALRAAALAGIGLVALPDWAVGRQLAEGTLVRVLGIWAMPGSGIYAVYPSNRMVTTRVRAWVDHLVRHMRSALPG